MTEGETTRPTAGIPERRPIARVVDPDQLGTAASETAAPGTPPPQQTHHVHDGISLDVDVYAVDATGPTPAVLVLPGGGFREHTAHDGEGYARWLTSIGVAAVVLRYRLVPSPFPLALQQARAALSALQGGELVKGVDTARVGVIGSSAGGMLAGLLATGAVLTNEQRPDGAGEPPRPAFQIQSYGLADLGLLPEFAVTALLGEDMHLASELSPARRVNATTPPTFVWVTAQDGPGLPNALALTRALADHRVPVELHVYPEGGHGVGLADGVAYGAHGHTAIPHTANWTADCARWLRSLDVL